jgi:hypothetical protein
LDWGTFTLAKHDRRSPVPWHLPQMTNFKILLVNAMEASRQAALPILILILRASAVD